MWEIEQQTIYMRQDFPTPIFMQLLSKIGQWALNKIGITKEDDLSPIPDAQLPKVVTPTPVRIAREQKRVTFSPAKEYIPDYAFDQNSKDQDKKTPSKLIQELQEICPDNCSEQLFQLSKIVEDLKEELEDLKRENQRLQREFKIINGEHIASPNLQEKKL